MDTESVFQHASTFESRDHGGTVRLGRLEAHYEQLFAEAIEDGVITAEERARLDKAAETLGLDRGRLRELEEALGAAYEARHRTSLREVLPGEDDAPRPSLSIVEGAVVDPRVAAMERRISFLEARVEELERELEEARAHVAVEVDLSEADTVASAAPEDDPAELRRRIRLDPRNPELHRRLYQACQRAGDVDGKVCAAQALVYLGQASDAEAAAWRDRAGAGLIRPQSPLGPDAWRRLLFHPDEEQLTGDIFGAVVPAVLLGRVAALRSAKALPALDPARKQDARTSTVQAVRCFVWAAATLGMPAPPLYADPDLPGLVEMVPGVPPASRLGRLALAGRTPEELAFLAGQHLAWYREEHFVRLLLPSIPDLEDIFLAALLIGSPALPLGADVKRRVGPIARAIEPILEPAAVDRLRGHFLRFVEDGGRTNLQRWAAAAQGTSLRAGFLLAGDLQVAERMLELERATEQHAKMDDLIVFLTSERHALLRKQLGIAAQA